MTQVRKSTNSSHAWSQKHLDAGRPASPPDLSVTGWALVGGRRGSPVPGRDIGGREPASLVCGAQARGRRCGIPGREPCPHPRPACSRATTAGPQTLGDAQSTQTVMLTQDPSVGKPGRETHARSVWFPQADSVSDDVRAQRGPRSPDGTVPGSSPGRRAGCGGWRPRGPGPRGSPTC